MRLTHTTKRVLFVLLDAPAGKSYGFQIARAARLPSGTIYPILRRLEQAGWLTARIEEIDEHEAGRRKRVYYRLTAVGERKALDATREEAAALSLLAPGWGHAYPSAMP